MSFRINLPNDPVTATLIVCLLFVFALFAFFLALFVVVPIAALTIAGVLYWRYYSLQKMKSHDKLPDTIKERPDYMLPEDFARLLADDDVLHQYEEPLGLYSCRPLVLAFNSAIAALYSDESFYKPPRRPHHSITDKITINKYYDQLERWQRKVSDRQNLGLFFQMTTAAYLNLRDFFPRYALQTDTRIVDSKLTTPLQLSDDRKAGEAVIGAFYDADLRDNHILDGIREDIVAADEHAHSVAFSTHFARTPFRVFNHVEIPIKLAEETRAAGMWICAPQGTGKTTLLHSLVAESLESSASVILMDTKGDLIGPFLNNPALAGRRIVIGPDDPVGMNPFDIPKSDISKTIQNLEYLFSSIEDYAFSAVQLMVLKATFRALMTAFENPTLRTLQELLAPKGELKFEAQLKTLDLDQQTFFFLEYNSNSISERRKEVSQRLRSLLDSNDLIRQMFMAEKTTFRISEAMDSGEVVVINASRGRLGGAGAEFLGRFFIMQILAAAQERSFRLESDKRPVHFYIDEAHTIVKNDEKITDVLHECRSQNIALAVAHQEMSQISEKVLSAFRNCAIRFAHPDEEARAFSSILRMDLRTLQTLKKKKQFGAFIRGLSDEGIVVNVEQTDLSLIQPRQVLLPKRPRTLPPSPQEPPPSGPFPPSTPELERVSAEAVQPRPKPNKNPPDSDPDAPTPWT